MTSSVVSTSTSTKTKFDLDLLRRHPGVELGLVLLVDLPLFSQRDDLLPREGKLYTCVPVHSCTGTGTGRCNMYL